MKLMLYNIGRSPGKGILALLRCHAYLQASKWDQALKDAQVAKAYPPLSITNGKDIWPEAYAAYSHAMEGSQVKFPPNFASRVSYLSVEKIEG